MGRTIRRVPLDFDYPLNKTWEGFLNPHYKECGWCRGRGSTEEAQRFDEFCRRIITAAEASHERPDNFTPGRVLKWPDNRSTFTTYGSLRDAYAVRASQLPRWPFPDHDPVDVLLAISGKNVGWLTDVEETVIRRIARIEVCEEFSEPQFSEMDFQAGKLRMDPTGRRYYPHPYLCWEDGIHDVGPRFKELMEALDISVAGIGCSSRAWTLAKAIKKHVGLEMETVTEDGYTYDRFKWGYCDQCGGEGIDPSCKEAYEAWEEYDPPEGEAYQIWETTSEGSAITPPFATPEELARWAVANGTSTFASHTMGYEEWMKFICGPGWAPSLVLRDDGWQPGAEGFGD